MENFVERFTHIASEYPEQTALVCGEDTLTYRQLDILSSKIAARLIRKGAGRDKIYPIVLERSTMYVAAMIGILKSGAAYAPLLTEYPENRIEYIKKDCGAELTVDAAFLAGIENEQPLDSMPNIASDDIAVVIYTSGSTGEPKGVVHTHKSIADSVYRYNECFDTYPGYRAAVNAPFSFVVSVQSILSPLAAAGSAYIFPYKALRDPLVLAQLIEKYKVERSYISPKMLRLFKPAGDSLRTVTTGGERVSGVYSDKFNIKVFYGQTESASGVMMFDIDKKYDNTPIGRPIGNIKAYLLDENGKPADKGEICLAGNFAQCYLRLPEQSKKTFTDNPFKEQDGFDRLLHTGDIAKKDENGDLIYIDRKDWMVKVNGQRVEMGEVEVRLSKVPGVENAAVAHFTDSNGQTYICGYYVSQQKLDDSFIRAELAKTLPDYMIPRFITALDKLPLTSNGKVDRKALKAPEAKDFAVQYRPPRTDAEKLVCKAFENLLGLERVGVDDDFFALGGDSIKSVMLQEQLSGYCVSAKQIFEKRTPCEIAKCLTQKSDEDFAFEQRDAYPMTDPQLGIYLANMQDMQSLEYNTPSSTVFDRDTGIDAQRLADAVKQTAELYPFMKVCAKVVDGKPCIVPVKDMQIDIPVIKTDETDEDKLMKSFLKPFDLENGPLFRFAVYDTPNGAVLLFDVHHLITDGTSQSLFMKNLALVYAGKTPEKEAVSSFALCSWEQKQKQSSRFDECKKFFDDMLSGVEVDSNIIADEIDNKPEKNGGHMTFKTNVSVDADVLQGACREMKITENTLFLGAFAYALAKQSGQELALLCAVENGRHIPELKNTFGMLVHTLPLCIEAKDSEDTRDYLAKVQNILFESLDHDLVSIVQLASEYEVNSDILFVYQGEMFSGVEFEGRTVHSRLHKTGDAMAKLSVDVFKDNDGYTLSFEYRKDMYLDETIENFAHLYINILKGLAGCKKLGEIALCGDREKEFYRRHNDNKVEFDRSLTLVDLFRKQVKAHPDNTAVVFKDKKLTYAQLDKYSENLAKLLARNGVVKEQPVGIMVKRCELFPICTLAVLKAGGACQPLDSNYPQDRLEFMLEDSKARVVISDDELAGLIPDFKGTVISAQSIYSLSDDSETMLDAPDADTLFALIYTSGSTGKPKGCMLEHKNLVNFCISFSERFGVTDSDRFAAYGAFGFDASMQDMYPALTSGAAVYIVPEETRLDLIGLHEFVIGNKITMMDCTTQLGRQYITAYPQSPYMRTFTVGGEKLVPCQPPEFDFVNTYGPTECTIYVSDYRVDRQYESVPIGKSFGNCDIYILDKSGRLLPPGAVGELVISGYPVTRGYLGRDELTREKFIENNIFDIDGYERMYLTGDVCRYLSNGNIQFVGRRDEQVKIRGFRIELTEIERRIREFEGITDASVIAADLPSGGKAVIAYVVSESKVDVPLLNGFIAEELPPYMVPSVTMQIDSIPITPNGKVDKRKLPQPSLKTDEKQQARQLNSLEKKLCGMVSGITGLETDCVTDSLVSLGITSLTAIMLAAKLFESFGLKTSATDLLDNGCTLMALEEKIIDRLLNTAPQTVSDGKQVRLDSVRLCAEQLGVYYDSVKDPEAIIYNIPMKYTFAKGTDAQRLRDSLEKLILANPVLSSRIDMENGEIVQKQIPNFKPYIPVLSFNESELAQKQHEFVKPFKLSRGPLFRAAVIQTPNSVVLLFDVHHIIMDGISLSLMLSKLVDIYGGAETETDTSYYDYIAAEEKLENSEKGDAAREYYKQLFADYENASEISADLNGDAEKGGLKEAVSLLDKSAAEQFCRANSVTPAALLLAATEYAVSRLTADRQVYISMISGGRDDVRFMDSLGMFVKSLPLHAAIDTQRTVSQFISDTASAMTDAQKNSAYPFIKLYGKYGFASKINYACQLGVDSSVTLDGREIEESIIVAPLPKFSLSVHINEKGDRIAVNVQYNDALYSDRLAQMISSAIACTAENMISGADGKLCGISMMRQSETEMIKSFANTGRRDIPIMLYHRLFEHQAKAHPERTALIACDASYTYEQLDRLMNCAANALTSMGVKKGDRVAVLLPRTSRQIIAMYAVLKAGGAYIPCDPEYPKDRIEYILENSGARYIITDGEKGYANEINIEKLLENKDSSEPKVDIEPSDTAYLIYTSGSTGRPKGVVIRHGSIANYLTPYEENIHIHALANEGTVYVSVTTVSFDMSLKETAAALCSGLTLVLADEAQTKDPHKLCELFEKTGGDVFNATPSRLEQYMLLDEFRAVLARCRIIMCGGEKYSPKLLRDLHSVTDARIFNTYGPTEITVSCNAKELTQSSEVCVGKPLLNVNEYIVDADGNLLPCGVVGELYVGGAGVADGYLNNEELTQKSFTVYNEERIYKTGDYARWTDEGDVVILGRTDDQVKLRGLRIELGEVERAILAHEGVRQAVALIAKINGAEHLCAYYCADESITPDDVRSSIAKRLTAYMIPSSLMRLDSMPQTPNGKIDKKALPAPALSFTPAYSEPVNDTEKALCGIFAQVLGLDKVSADSSFFDLGGTSLTVTSVLVKANEMGFEVSYTDIFTHKSPRGIAQMLTHSSDASDGLDKYDYSGFDSILAANTIENICQNTNETGELLLTGATGYLGIHILKSFLESQNGKVYCLLRSSKQLSALNRLKGLYYYYFEKELADYEDRLTIIEGSITSDKWFAQLDGIGIDTVINCAALVKHFSETDDIERVNAGGVKNLIEFCKKHNSMLVQVSTGSVAGDRVNGYPDKDKCLDERSFYFGQTIDNQYVHSKFLAERYVLEAIGDGLKAKIMRVGNLSARSGDGEFQINFLTNGFIGRLRAYLVIGAIPYDMLDYPVELAPINETADAILRLCSTSDKCCIFHPFNNHYIPLGDIITRMIDMGLDIRLVERDEFIQCVKDAESDKEKSAMLTTLLAYANRDSSKTVEMIHTDNEYTTQVLYRLGFRWSMTADEYITGFLKALYGLGFFDVEDKA